MTFTTRKELLETATNDYNRAVKGQAEQLYFCKAWIFTDDYSDFTILQSYATIVAAFQRSAGILWVFGFYSNTTAQHIAKFKKWLRNNYRADWSFPKVVRLYNDSKTGKRTAQKNMEDDFASVIATALNQR